TATVTPGSTAPVVSLTEPAMALVEADCAEPRTGASSRRLHRPASRQRRVMTCISMPPVFSTQASREKRNHMTLGRREVHCFLDKMRLHHPDPVSCSVAELVLTFSLQTVR